MKDKETLVATMSQEVLNEQQLSQEITGIEFQAESFVILTDEDYAAAGEFGKLLKRKATEVISFFRPMKDSAYQAHKAVCDREKDMLTPLRNAESAIKKTMGSYLIKQEHKCWEAEEVSRREAEVERERKFLEATELEKTGDKEKAETAMTEAIVMDEATTYSVSAAPPKVDGVSASKDWEIVEIDPSLVPLAIAGMELRPVDQTAVMRLIRASKGKIEIPGIVYHEVTKISFRR